MNFLVKIIRPFSRLVCWISIVSLAAMIILTCTDVLLRHFGHPILGSYEITRFLMAIVIALPLAYTQILQRHIAIDFIVLKYPPRTQNIIDSSNCVFIAPTFILLFYALMQYGTKLLRVGSVSDTLGLSFSPFIYIVAIGCLIKGIVVLVEFTQSLNKVIEK